jgi:hypothetical protein
MCVLRKCDVTKGGEGYTIEKSCLIDFTIYYYHDEIKKCSTWKGSHLSNTEKLRNVFKRLSEIPKDSLGDLRVEDSMILKSILGM